MPASIDAVTAAEAQLGHQLPAGYRNLLLTEANGGEVEFPAGEDDVLGIAAVFGLNRDEYYFDLGYHLRTFEDDVVAGFFPFASAAGGNLLCISMRESELGTIWFWDHEIGPEYEGDPPLMESLTFVAPSFDALRAGEFEDPGV